MDELTLDKCFWREISTSLQFRNWLLSRTKFAGQPLELVSNEETEKWHQRWYQDPITKRQSETDILLIFRQQTTEERYALHIENKPAHGKWRQNQPESYRIRALDKMSDWRYQDFETILLAPDAFLQRYAAEAKHFDIRITYEEVSAYVQEFGEPSQSEAAVI